MNLPISKRQLLILMLLFAVLACGLTLRLVWVGDMEYKNDERKLFIVSQHAAKTGEWPSLGMISSTGMRNPAMSDWIFILLSKGFSVEQPTDLAMAVRGLNCLGLLLLFCWAWRQRNQLRRFIWLWVSALAAVSPFMILFQRKIWAQSTLPLFLVLLLIAVSARHRRIGAFGWGLLTILLGQIHMASFFFTAAVFCSVFLFDRKSILYRWFFAGVLCGLPPMLPWLLQARSGGSGFTLNPIYGWGEVFRLRYWRYWFTEPLGLKLTYSLGAAHFQEFGRYPGDTGLVKLAHWASLAVGGSIYLGFLVAVWRRRGELWRSMRESMPTELLLFFAAFVLYGLVLSMYTVNTLVYRHYLITVYPLTLLFLVALAVFAFPKRVANLVLATSFVLQLFTSANFLYYIRIEKGTTNADSDYGTAYQHQPVKEYYIDENGDLREK